MIVELTGNLSLWILLALLAVGSLAGFVDTLAGGGGMLTVPALLISGLPPDAALSTNKLQSSFGTCYAAWYFIRRGHLNFRKLLPGIIACAIGSALGSAVVQILPKDWLSSVIPVLLIVVAAIFIFIPALGEVEQEARLPMSAFLIGALAPIGFYDGFLGPGTGSFILLSLIALRGYTLQHATIEAKLYNGTTNLVALFIFMLGGKIIWLVGFAMAAGQLIGARIASGMILSKGNKLIRPMVITMSVLMSLYLIGKNWFHLY